MTTQILDLETLLKVPYVDPEAGFDLSPDGSKIAFAWNRSGQWEIYELNLDLTTPAHQISEGPGGKFSPRYAPDGGRLAYVCDLDGGEVFDIYTYNFSTEAHTNLTSDDAGSILPGFCWSPDGSQIAYISDRSGHFDTYVMPSQGGRGRLVLGFEEPDVAVKWSPDGRWLAITSEAKSQNFTTYILSLDGGQSLRVEDEGGTIDARHADWSPDSTRLVFSSSRLGWQNVGIYILGNGQIEWVTEGEGDKVSPRWSPDGTRLVYLHSQEEATWLGILRLDDSSHKTFLVGKGVHYAPRFSIEGDSLVCIYDDPKHPSDVWSLDLQDAASRQITRSLPLELESAPFIEPEVIRYPGMGGEAIPALLFKPGDSGQIPPAVVIIHGGPSWLFQLTWYPLMQHMVSRGWVVLAPNYHGSTGYGREWQIANHFEQGNLDTQDVAAGAQFLVTNGLADPQKIAVTGRSHGGYLTMSCLTRFPELWAVGSAIVPFLNWFTSHANSRQDLQHWDIQTMGDPQEYHDLWYERSPFFFLDRVRAPVQLICGENDPRCPASESTAARDKLLEMGKQVDFKLYEGEGHGFLKIENVIDSEVRRVEFLAKVLENDN